MSPQLRTFAQAGLIVLVIRILFPCPSRAQESTADELREKWFALYAEHAGSVEMRVDAEIESVLEFQQAPLLTYSNPIRVAQQHGSIFVWTQQGRPAVIASICSALDQEQPGQRRLNYEWHSLLEESVVASRENEQLWNSSAPGVEWQTLASRLDVSSSRPLRLTQMRRIAESFTTEIEAPEGRLRLMSQPIYRYPEDATDVRDGAVFAVVMGTDPELFILMEARSRDGAEAEWQVAFARFTNAPVTVLREQREIWSCDQARAFERTGPFFLWFAVERHPADLGTDAPLTEDVAP